MQLWWRREEREPEPEPRDPRFACRTCGEAGPFYAAQHTTRWTRLSEPYRTPGGLLTYRHTNVFLPGVEGDEFAYMCGNCRATEDALEDLVLEPSLARDFE